MTDFRKRLMAHMRPDRQPRAQAPAVTQDGNTATVRLYDSIDSWGEWYGLSAKEFADVIDALPDGTDQIRVLINSPGGEVTEGIAILNLLRNHPARTVAIVEGVAASSASFIAAGCDELVMSRNSTLMVHAPWVLCIGDAEDMRSSAELLDSFEGNIASIYADKAGGTVDEWRAVMHAETWFTATEAVEAGLADQINDDTDTDDGAPTPVDRFDLTIFNFAGRDNAPEPQYPVGQPTVGSPTAQGGSAVAFSDEQLTDLRQKLDVDADADEATILDAVDTLLEQATAPSNNPSTAATDAALPDGVVAISEAQLTELRNDAQAGRAARNAQVLAEREALVTAAVHDGRIAPAERDAWITKLEAGTGAEQVLASLKPGVVPVEQHGHGGTVDLDSDDALYAELFGADTKEVTR